MVVPALGARASPPASSLPPKTTVSVTPARPTDTPARPTVIPASPSLPALIVIPAQAGTQNVWGGHSV